MADDWDIDATLDAMAVEDLSGQPGRDVESGAPLLDRLAAAFKFSESGVENYLKERYGAPNVERGTDGGLYFLPPDQLSLPYNDRTYVKFNPEGFDAGDIVSAAPSALAAAVGVGTAAATGGASVPILLGSLFTGGAAAEGVTQAIGAAIPGDEPTATAGARAERIATSGLLETAAGGAGEALKVVGPAMVQGVREGSRRSFQQALRTGVSPETIEATEALGRRVGLQFSEGQITGGRGALLAERFARQNFFSAGLVREADAAALDALGRHAQKTINQLGKQPFETGIRNAVGAHTAYVSALDAKRNELTSPLFNKARAAFGNDRVVSMQTPIDRLRELADELQSDVPTDDTRFAAEWIANKLDDLAGGKTSIKSLQNMLSDWGKAAYDPRGVIEKVQGRDLKKRIAATFFGGLKDALEETADNYTSVIREGASGQFRSGKQVAAAADALRDARAIYREISEAISEVADNPLGDFVDKPEGLVNLFLGQQRDPTTARQIMGFLNKTSPENASELRSAVMQKIVERAQGGNIDQPLSPAKLRTIADRASTQINELFAGDKAGKAAFNDMVSAARILADQGSLQGAQTEFMDIVGKAMQAIALPAVAGTAFMGGGGLGGTADEFGALAGLFFSSRWLARSMMHPPAARAYSKVFTAMRKPNLSEGAKRAARQAALDIVNFNRRMEMTDREPRGTKDLMERVRQFSPGGL